MAVDHRLAEKGFDAMTVDAVIADVGIAKARLYKHFGAKEELAAAAVIRLLDRALSQMDLLRANDQADEIEQLKSVARWTMQVQLAGKGPSRPGQNLALRMALKGKRIYLDQPIQVSERLGEWVTAGQRACIERTASGHA